MHCVEPTYLKSMQSGELKRKVSEAEEHLSNCDLCGWECKIDRHGKKLGVCNTGMRARVSSYGPHLGEEDPLRGWRGSGTIFFARCNLHCQYCQNHDISQSDCGEEIGARTLAGIMLKLQQLGCHNINLVSPSHVVAPILEAILIAAEAGLRLPLVYNTGGYDSQIALTLLNGVVDIYMPDMKYSDAQVALHYSKVKNYPQINQLAVREMHRQTGDLQINSDGLATRGLLVRHLVLPNGLAGTGEIVRFLAQQISNDTYLNLMDQYRPAYKASQFPELNRPLTADEYHAARNMAEEAGITRLDKAARFSFIGF